MKFREFRVPASLTRTIRRSKRLVVLTGSGLGLASGLPPSRDGLTGLWSLYDESALATAQGFNDDPEQVWNWLARRHWAAAKAQPNAAHRAISALSLLVPDTVVITQNGDGLHQRAGSRNVLELHGGLGESWCIACGVSHPLAQSLPPPSEPSPTAATLATNGGRSCRYCERPARPARLWHGEPPAEKIWNAAMQAVRKCDILLTAGTSCLTPAASGLAYEAIAAGAALIQANPNPTPIDRLALHNVRGRAEIALGEIVRMAWPRF